MAEYGDNPVEYINELNVLAHQEDTTRPTTSASNQSGKINFVTDLIAWNRYDGWYGGTDVYKRQESFPCYYYL